MKIETNLWSSLRAKQTVDCGAPGCNELYSVLNSLRRRRRRRCQAVIDKRQTISNRQNAIWLHDTCGFSASPLVLDKNEPAIHLGMMSTFFSLLNWNRAFSKDLVYAPSFSL